MLLGSIIAGRGCCTPPACSTWRRRGLFPENTLKGFLYPFSSREESPNELLLVRGGSLSSRAASQSITHLNPFIYLYDGFRTLFVKIVLINTDIPAALSSCADGHHFEVPEEESHSEHQVRLHQDRLFLPKKKGSRGGSPHNNKTYEKGDEESFIGNL